MSGLLGDNAPGGIVSPEFYNQLGAMHGTIMVFLGVVPLAVGAFGNYVLPLPIGAPDMAFPRWNEKCNTKITKNTKPIDLRDRRLFVLSYVTTSLRIGTCSL